MDFIDQFYELIHRINSINSIIFYEIILIS